MLNQSTVERVVLLLAQDQLSLRQIAAKVGVSHSSVANIANGMRGTHGAETDYGSLIPHAGRCPSCGAKVHLPCVACQARDYRRRKLEQNRGASPEPFNQSRVA